MKHTTTVGIRKMKERVGKIVMVTAYDYPSAVLVDEAGVDVILVGDTLGMVVLGYDSTIPVTLNDMLHHTKAVVRGVKRALVTVDLPFLTYQTSSEDALRNAGRLIQQGGAAAVKLEGGIAVCPQVRTLVSAGIPVMGHLGLTPQSIHIMGGYKVQGRDETAALKLLAEARSLEDAGIFSLVLECVPVNLAARITEALSIPTIGIGAGPYCDGQVLVLHDLLGIEGSVRPRFVKQYAHLSETIRSAVAQYAQEVRQEQFPTLEQSYVSHETSSLPTTSRK